MTSMILSMMTEEANISLDIQVACDESSDLPTSQQLHQWVEESLVQEGEETELVIRIVDESESAELNSTYRQRDKSTNVLSFPSVMPKELEPSYLGDLVICAAVVQREAREQNKTAEAHWAHMVVHGTLHLQGFDHLDDEEASIMEAKEIFILNNLGFSNPYETG